MNKQITCFLIDDDKDEYDIFCIALRQVTKPVKCVYSNDPHEALEKLQNDQAFQPDLIFMDINMPRMNGVQCLAEIKNTSRLHHIPVFMYSTSSNDSLVQQCRDLGAADYIVKPISISDIKDTIQSILTRIETLKPS